MKIEEGIVSVPSRGLSCCRQNWGSHAGHVQCLVSVPSRGLSCCRHIGIEPVLYGSRIVSVPSRGLSCCRQERIARRSSLIEICFRPLAGIELLSTN